MKKMTKWFRIRQFKTTAYHPQSNGSLERSHHVLKEYLEQFIENNAELYDWIELAMFSYNTNIYHITGTWKNGNLWYVQHMTKLITKLHEMRGIARWNLIAAKEKSKEYYNRKINPQNFEIGDSVFLLEGGELQKFENQYSGRYEVLEILGKGSIKISVKNKPKIVNINRLRLSYITPPATNQRKKN